MLHKNLVLHIIPLNNINPLQSLEFLTMTFEDYLKEELKYYRENPSEDDPLEAHSNAVESLDYDYTAHE